MNKLPLLTKSFLGFSIFLAIPLVLMGFYFNYNLVRYSEDEISKSSIVNLQNVKKLNDQLVDSITKQSIRLSLDVVLQDIGGISDYYELHNNVDNMLKLSKTYQILEQTANIDFRIQSIYVYLENANYVITSKSGPILKDEFQDTAWIEQYQRSRNMTTGTLWLDSRPVNGVSRKPADNNNVLTFIMPLRRLMVNYDGAVVVNVYERELYNLINDTSYQKEGSVVIINNEGKVVSHSDKLLIGKNISDSSYVRKIITSTAPWGYFIEGSGGGSRMYTYYKSEFNNWIYVGDISIKSLIANTGAMRNGMIALILVLMLLGIVFSYFFSKNMYNPVRKLMNEIRKRKDNDLRDGGNEMAIITKVFDSMARQEANLSSALEKDRQALKNKYINDLLSGDTEEASQYGEFAEEFPYGYFTCALITIDRYDAFIEKYTHEQQYYMKLLILKTCCEVMDESLKVSGVLYEKNKIAIIANSECFLPLSADTPLYSGLERLKSEVAKVLSNSITVGIGGCCDNTAGIGASFGQACEALKDRILKGHGSIIIYDSLREAGKYFYPYQHEKHILNFLRLGSQVEAVTAIRELMEEIRAHRDCSCDNILQIFIQLLGNTVKYLVEININIGSIFGTDYNIYQKLSSRETLEDIETWLTGFYSGVVLYISGSSDKNKTPADLILDYIHQNYRQNIDTTSIADSTGLGYSSVGRLVKASTGKNVLEYINGLRIEEAKRLLRQTGMNLRDIAANIGYNNEQSLSRFFKKYEGVTPGEFRDMN